METVPDENVPAKEAINIVDEKPAPNTVIEEEFCEDGGGSGVQPNGMEFSADGGGPAEFEDGYDFRFSPGRGGFR